MIRSLLIAALVLGAAGPASADTVRVGVVVATRVNVTEGEADALGAELGDALRDRLAVDVVAGSESRRRLPPGGVKEDCVARPACVRDVAERLDGDDLLFLVVVRLGPRVQVDSTWVRVSTGQVASRPALVIEDGVEAAGAVFARSARRLLPGAPTRPVNTPVTIASRPEPGGRRVTAPVAIAGGVSLAALAGGVGFALSARADYSDLESDGCDRVACSGAEDRVDAMERKALTADILFGTAAAAAGVALFMYLGSAEREAPPVRIGADGDGAHVWLGGQF